MVSYQNCFYFYYHKINLRRYILCYCPLTYNNNFISERFYIKPSWNIDFLTNIESVLLWYCQRQFLRRSKKSIDLNFNQQQQAQRPNSCYHNTAKNNRQSSIRGQPFVVRQILNHTIISWIQVILGNTLLYPVSVKDCPGPECGVFCILTLNIISRSALVLFSLLRARNYHYNKGPLKVESIWCKIIHSRLLRIIFLQKILLR